MKEVDGATSKAEIGETARDRTTTEESRSTAKNVRHGGESRNTSYQQRLGRRLLLQYAAGTAALMFGPGVGGASRTDPLTAIGDPGANAIGASSAQVAGDGDIYEQVAKLLDSNGESSDSFGGSVAIDGDTTLVGAIRGGQNDGGAAYVFERSTDGWVQSTELLVDGTETNDLFGFSVAIDGDTALVGAPGGGQSNEGAAYVFERSTGGWGQPTELLASDGANGDRFGTAVAINGDTALVGAPNENQKGRFAGAAYLFTRSANGWEQLKLIPDSLQADESFGTSVALSSDRALIGAPGATRNGVIVAGAAYVLVQSRGTWNVQRKLFAKDPGTFARFGSSVAIDEIALIGADGADGNGSRSGAAYVFERSTFSWEQKKKLIANDGQSEDEFGSSVAIDGDTAVVGAAGEDDSGGSGFSSMGAAYVFRRSDWEQLDKLRADDGGSDDRFGDSVSIDGDTALVGAPRGGQNNEGAAYVFTRSAEPENLPPTASFSSSPTDPEAGEEITFDASASQDDGEITEYAWDFGDGTTETTADPVVTHAYDEAGEYTVTLTVTDDDGATATAEETVTVVVFSNPLVNGYVPQDLDGDGLYEDVNGDGVATGKGKEKGDDLSALEDVIAAYDNGNGDLKLAAAQVDALDFDRDGQLTGADVGELNKILKDKDKEKDKGKDEKNKKK